MIGEAITRIRKEKKIKQKDFAKEIGTNVTYLSQIENNRSCTIEYLKKIAEGLNITFAELLFEGLEKEQREKYISNFRENEYIIEEMLRNLR